jgi:hypothetical protein
VSLALVTMRNSTRWLASCADAECASYDIGCDDDNHWPSRAESATSPAAAPFASTINDENGEKLAIREERELADEPRHGFIIPPVCSNFNQPDVLDKDAKLGRSKYSFSFEKLLAGDTMTSSSQVALFPADSGELTHKNDCTRRNLNRHFP